MSFGAGSLTLWARREGPRTVLGRVRFEGISRCSRAFAHGDAALVVLSQYGPGVVRGDRVTTSGRVEAGAHLIVTQQSATRLMGGSRDAESATRWFVADGARLDLVGEPVVAGANARYRALTSIELAAHARVTLSDVARVPAGAEVRLCASVQRCGREVFYDALDAGAAAPLAVGTFAVLGIDVSLVDRLVRSLDAAVDTLTAVRSGVGALPCGAFVRVVAPDIWAVQSALHTLRAVASGER